MSRDSAGWRARYTTAIPPRPTSLRIRYGPTCSGISAITAHPATSSRYDDRASADYRDSRVGRLRTQQGAQVVLARDLQSPDGLVRARPADRERGAILHEDDR